MGLGGSNKATTLIKVGLRSLARSIVLMSYILISYVIFMVVALYNQLIINNLTHTENQISWRPLILKSNEVRKIVSFLHLENLDLPISVSCSCQCFPLIIRAKLLGHLRRDYQVINEIFIRCT